MLARDVGKVSSLTRGSGGRRAAAGQGGGLQVCQQQGRAGTWGVPAATASEAPVRVVMQHQVVCQHTTSSLPAYHHLHLQQHVHMSCYAP